MSTTEIIKHIFTLPENQQWQVVLGVLQNLQHQSKESSLASPGEPMSMEVFQERLAKANQDIVQGRVFSTDETSFHF